MRVPLPDAKRQYILKAMRRPYTIERLPHHRAAACDPPDIYISTDVIVGFPGETEADFELTRQHFEEIGFDMAYLFKYSVRPDTTAEVPATWPTEVKEARNQVLLETGKRPLQRNESLVGTVEEVLFEGPRKGEDVVLPHPRPPQSDRESQPALIANWYPYASNAQRPAPKGLVSRYWKAKKSCRPSWPCGKRSALNATATGAGRT